MARTTRNEYGLTNHQQKRFDAIVNHMESNHDRKKNTDRSYSPDSLRLELTKMNLIQEVEDNLLYMEDNLEEFKKLFEGLKQFRGKENDIDISADEALVLTNKMDVAYNKAYALTRCSAAIITHTGKKQKIKELAGKQDHPFQKEEVMKDLLALNKEFVSMKFNVKTGRIYAVTEDIVLTDGHGKDVNLGPFSLIYDTSDSYLIVRAKAKKPIRHQRGTHFHPHVRPGGQICLGDGAAPLQKAHEQGDIFTIFITLKNIISTYNSGSPYAPLETWMGETCEHCGGNVSYLRECDLCGDKICNKCHTRTWKPDGGSFNICTTCKTEDKNKCQGHGDKPCTYNNFINPKTHKQCWNCHTEEENEKERLEKEKKAEEIAKALLEVREAKAEEIEANQEAVARELSEPILQNVSTGATEPVEAPHSSIAVFNTLNEILGDNPLIRTEETCKACNLPLTEEHLSTCISCENTTFCTPCAIANECEFCGATACPDCMAPCSTCRINTHITCMNTNLDGNLECPSCAEKRS